MKVAIWDTYVQRKDGRTMHFDIAVPSELTDESTVYQIGRAYLHEKNEEGQPLTARECQFCHIERASDEMQQEIREKGYSIIEMEGCDQ